MLVMFEDEEMKDEGKSVLGKTRSNNITTHFRLEQA